MSDPNIVRVGLFDIQVCVPADYTDEQVEVFTNTRNICGTTKGWTIRTQDMYEIEDVLERQPCDKYPDNVHIMLDA